MSSKERLGSPQPGDRVLWIRFWAFGDTLEAVANAYNFKRRFPDTHLTFLTHPEYEDMLRALPYIDDVITGRKSPFAEWRGTLQKIRDGRYKWLVSGHRGGKTSLLARFGRAQYRIGSGGLLFNCNYHMNLQDWGRTCGFDAADRSSPSIFPAAEDREAADAFLARLPERRLFALVGAGVDVRKMWPNERWIEFLRPLVDEGWGIVLNGHGLVEEANGQRIESALASRNVLNLVGALGFRKMAGVAYRCTLAVGNETGPLHLAALSGVPTMGFLSHGPFDSAALLTMPWFRVVLAEELIPERRGEKFLMKFLPSEPVAKAFNAFAEEFLPKAFAWRGNG